MRKKYIKKQIINLGVLFCLFAKANNISCAENIINHSTIPNKIRIISMYNGENRKKTIEEEFNISFKRKKTVFSKNIDEYYFFGKIGEIDKGDITFSHIINNNSLSYKIFLSVQSSDCLDFQVFENEFGSKNYQLSPIVAPVVARNAVWKDNNYYLSVSYVQRSIGIVVKKCVYSLDMDGKGK